MMDILLFIHVVVALLLITVILLQQSGSDGLSGLGGSSGGNMGLVSARSAATFLTRVTVVLAAIFLINAIVLANLSARKRGDSEAKFKELHLDSEEPTLPVAK
jgi:preprotein translocase subunit SecG